MTELDGFTLTRFTHGGLTRDVYRAGTGPGVVVIHEMPGITPKVADFARRVVDNGFTVAMPSLFGTPGRTMTPLYALNTMVRGCVAREFTTWATGRTSPIIAWLRALARDLHEQAGGPGVGAVGMCFTGGFALAMAVDDDMLAPVLSQPSAPFPVGKARSCDLGISDADLERVKQRAADDGLCVMGLRFSHDRFVPDARWQRLRDELGDAFLSVELDSSPGNRHGFPRTMHSVLAHDFRDEPGHPTVDALGRVLDFFRDRLQPA